MAAHRKTNKPMGTPFDRALELVELRRAAEAYASRHGQVGSAGYRTAWLKFRRRIQSIDELQRWRAKAARSAADRPPLPGRPLDRGNAIHDCSVSPY
jgi:hypothetical protein